MLLKLNRLSQLRLATLGVSPVRQGSLQCQHRAELAVRGKFHLAIQRSQVQQTCQRPEEVAKTQTRFGEQASRRTSTSRRTIYVTTITRQVWALPRI